MNGKILKLLRSFTKILFYKYCRTLLMACFLGHIKNVAQLINEYDVNPNVTDMQGNSALMYAAVSKILNVQQ